MTRTPARGASKITLQKRPRPSRRDRGRPVSGAARGQHRPERLGAPAGAGQSTGRIPAVQVGAVRHRRPQLLVAERRAARDGQAAQPVVLATGRDDARGRPLADADVVGQPEREEAAPGAQLFRSIGPGGPAGAGRRTGGQGAPADKQPGGKPLIAWT